MTTIELATFLRCTSLSSVTIPDSVTEIQVTAFAECSDLGTVFIPESVTSIGQDAFYGCTGLTKLTMEEGVTTIGAYAFDGCSGLTSVNIPKSVTSIENRAFYNCTGLCGVSFAGTETSLNNSFMGCTGLCDGIDSQKHCAYLGSYIVCGRSVWNVTVSSDENGTVVVDKTEVLPGDTVTITITPASGKDVERVVVAGQSGKEIPITVNDDGTYCYAQPEESVTIQVIYRDIDVDSGSGDTGAGDSNDGVDSGSAGSDSSDSSWSKRIVMQIGSRTIQINYRTLENDVAPVILNDRTYVPLRYIAEYTGAQVTWRADTQQIFIIK